MRNFIGRHQHIKNLESIWAKNTSQIACLYGRRRVGKSKLVEIFTQSKPAFSFEALEGENTKNQIQHFLQQLAMQCDEPHLAHLKYTDWNPVFELFTKKLFEKKKVVVFLDELPWMASGQTKLISLIKYYWDTQWKKHPHLFLILCGSLASFMVRNVVRSKALYGRISHSFLLEPLTPQEVIQFIGSQRGKKEALEYILCFGGIPKYLEEFDFNHSLQINIDKTCFRNSGFFTEEGDKIFYSQFRETKTYKHITEFVTAQPRSISEIAKKLKISNGGGLKQYLENLEMASIIESIPNIKNFVVGKTNRYVLTDEFLRFYASFIQPHQKEIQKNQATSKFEKFTANRFANFLGLAFERFCLKNAYTLAHLMEFENKVIGCGNIFNTKALGYQYDLVYIRSDSVITLCEIKYTTQPVGTNIIGDMEKKIKNTLFPKDVTIEKVLICNQPPMKAVVESRYFHKILTAQDIFE